MGRKDPDRQQAILTQLTEYANAKAEEAVAAEQLRIDMEAAADETFAYEERVFDEKVDAAWQEMRDYDLTPDGWLARHAKEFEANLVYYALLSKAEEEQDDFEDYSPWPDDHYDVVGYKPLTDEELAEGAAEELHADRHDGPGDWEPFDEWGGNAMPMSAIEDL